MASSYPLIRTKVRTPRRPPGLIRRQRLIDFLHGAIEHRLILIAAGAGYGKTSLLVDYAHDTDLPVCWYSLDAHDAHLYTFVEYLVASIRERFPQFGERVLQALAAHYGPPEDVEPFVRLLLYEIEEQIRQYFVLILDDYHEVLDSEPVNALLDGLLAYLPEQCHIILATRGIPKRLTLSRLAARRQVVGQSAHELAFTQEEIGELLAQMGFEGLSPSAIRRLAERCEGWVTGIILAAQSERIAAQDLLQLSGASGGVFDYMAQEVLDRQRDEVRRFVLRTALCRELSPPLCDSLLKINNSAQILRELVEQNLFTVSLDSEGEWYQYHQLFREFLLAKLEQDEPEECQHLRIKLATLMAHRGRWPQAIESYLAAGALTDAARSIEIVAQETFDGGEWEQLRKWIDSLPPSLLDDHPRLLLYRGKIHAERSELNEAMALFERSERSFLRRADAVGAARALVQQAVVQRFRGRFDEAIRLCRRVLEGDVRDSIADTAAHHNIGICHTMSGRFSEGIAALHEALRLAEANADDVNAGYIAHDIGVAELNRGHLGAGRKSLHRALMYWRKVGNPSALALTLQALGIIHHHLGEYVEADNRLQESLAKALDVGDQRAAAYTIVSQADLYRDMGRYAEADETYQRGLTVAAKSGISHLSVYTLASLGYTYRLMGDVVRARQLLVEAMDSLTEAMPYERGLCHFYWGVLALDQGERDVAEQYLRTAAEMLAGVEAKRDMGRVYLHLARLAYHQGEERAVEPLRKAADLAQSLGSSQFALTEALPVADDLLLKLLSRARELGIRGFEAVTRQGDLLALRRGSPSAGDLAKSRPAAASRRTTAAPVVTSPTMLPLEFLGLDGGQVLRAGEVVQDWESTVARTMIFLLLSHPRGLRRERVIDLLWPDAGPAKGNSLFHSTLYRVRSALGKDIVIHEQGGIYRINPEREYRYDVDEFQRLAKLALGQERAASDDARAKAGERALSLYRRPFLESHDYEWCVQIRRSLEDTFVALLHAQACRLIQAGAFEEAESLYVRVLHVDPYDERAHRGIMWSRSVRGDRSGAMRQFQACKEILADEMGITPEAETIHLYMALLAGDTSPPPPV
ncbi:MAG: tetratricopeptide repeat protein [Chloroflexi bacterium]|nr:tetratricopeptide repeat protein [Chloroflexota bacterium]